MPSKDLLGKLFDVEREAEDMVAAAREEAGKRLDVAKTRAQKHYAEAYEAALAKALASREDSEKSARADYEAALADYRLKLEGSRLDTDSFSAACSAILATALGEGR